MYSNYPEYLLPTAACDCRWVQRTGSRYNTGAADLASKAWTWYSYATCRKTHTWHPWCQTKTLT